MSIVKHQRVRKDKISFVFYLIFSFIVISYTDFSFLMILLYTFLCRISKQVEEGMYLHQRENEKMWTVQNLKHLKWSEKLSNFTDYTHFFVALSYKPQILHSFLFWPKNDGFVTPFAKKNKIICYVGLYFKDAAIFVVH